MEEESVHILNFVSDYPTSSYWIAYILRNKDPEKSRIYLDKASSLPPYLVFPFREESIDVFDWTVKQRSDNWKAKYYLSLIFWSKARIEESRTMLQDCESPDFPPFYFARGTLLKKKNLGSAQDDFEKAVNIDKDSWRSHYRLVQTIALPYEGATGVHRLFVEYHIQIAQEYMEKSNYVEAVKHIQKSKEYPENLGTGKPYHPDYSRQDKILPECYEKLDHELIPKEMCDFESQASEVPYGTGSWDEENYGNQRLMTVFIGERVLKK